MSRYQVNFIVKDWVHVLVDADNENKARERAEKRLGGVYDGKGIECVDGKTTYIGCLNESEINLD